MVVGSIYQDGYCTACNWPVFFAPNCDGFWEGDSTPWVVYCTKKSCVNHKGEGMQAGDKPDWFETYVPIEPYKPRSKDK